MSEKWKGKKCLNKSLYQIKKKDRTISCFLNIKKTLYNFPYLKNYFKFEVAK